MIPGLDAETFLTSFWCKKFVRSFSLVKISLNKSMAVMPMSLLQMSIPYSGRPVMFDSIRSPTSPLKKRLAPDENSNLTYLLRKLVKFDVNYSRVQVNLSAGSGPFEDQWRFFPLPFLET